jgi:TonB family protein
LNEENEMSFSGETVLQDALALWVTPATPPALDARVLASYRRLMAAREFLAESPRTQATLDQTMEGTMKQCPNCGEDFAPAFSFCPVDGAALEATGLLYTRPEYHLTVLEETGLTRRLGREIGLLKAQLKQAWPGFKRDPLGFTKGTLAAASAWFVQLFRVPHVATATVFAVLLVMSLSLAVILADGYRRRAAQQDGLVITELINLNDIPKPEEPEKEGPAGNNQGDGGGSKPKYEKPQGGGGGGDVNETRETSQGERPPLSRDPQVVVPKVEPPLDRPVLLPVTPTLKGDEALSKMPRDLQFGDPDSQSTDPSRGKGEGEGFGGGKGTGAGAGDGAGQGPGRGENIGGGDPNYGGGGPGKGGGKPSKPAVDYNREFSVKEVDRKAVIISKPEPPYTEEARKAAASGTVTLRVLLGANGAVLQITPLTRLPYGLTEQAVAAARKLRFTPAQKDGRNVAQWVQLQYDFNLY